jgi:hypothetical protein
VATIAADLKNMVTAYGFLGMGRLGLTSNLDAIFIAHQQQSIAQWPSYRRR